MLETRPCVVESDPDSLPSRRQDESQRRFVGVMLPDVIHEADAEHHQFATVFPVQFDLQLFNSIDAEQRAPS